MDYLKATGLAAAVIAVASVSSDSVPNVPTEMDWRRAHQPRPASSSHVYGAHPAAAFAAMNTHLKNADVTTRPCEGFTHEELNELSLVLLDAKNDEFNDLYTSREDNRAIRHDKEHYTSLWEQEAANARDSPATHGAGSEHHAMVRDGKCAEIIMWWIHHMTESTQASLSSVHGFTLPLMPKNGPVETDNEMYNYQISCLDCHSSPLDGPDGGKRSPAMPGKGDIPHRSQAQKNETACPILPETGKPAVWYEAESDVGNRIKRCDWDYDPPCQLCEGVGGPIWGDGEDEWTPTTCRPLLKPEDIPADTLTDPVWPFEFTVDESTILINDLESGGQFPGSDPCAPHVYKNQTETMWYTGKGPNTRISTFGFLDNTDIWALEDFNMYILIEKLFCICVTPRENGQGVPIGPLRYDFAEGSVLVGRELIGVEFRDGLEVVADHWMKGPHHFWISVETGLMVRGWQPFNGLNIYYNWDLEQPDMTKFIVEESCYEGPLNQNISCISPPPQL